MSSYRNQVTAPCASIPERMSRFFSPDSAALAEAQQLLVRCSVAEVQRRPCLAR